MAVFGLGRQTVKRLLPVGRIADHLVHALGGGDAHHQPEDRHRQRGGQQVGAVVLAERDQVHEDGRGVAEDEGNQGGEVDEPRKDVLHQRRLAEEPHRRDEPEDHVQHRDDRGPGQHQVEPQEATRTDHAQQPRGVADLHQPGLQVPLYHRERCRTQLIGSLLASSSVDESMTAVRYPLAAMRIPSRRPR